MKAAGATELHCAYPFIDSL